MVLSSVQSLLHVLAQFEEQIREILQQHIESQREKAEMWEKERQIMQTDMENLRVTLRTENEKGIEKGKWFLAYLEVVLLLPV